MEGEGEKGERQSERASESESERENGGGARERERARARGREGGREGERERDHISTQTPTGFHHTLRMPCLPLGELRVSVLRCNKAGGADQEIGWRAMAEEEYMLHGRQVCVCVCVCMYRSMHVSI